jgi:hypothetical protein
MNEDIFEQIKIHFPKYLVPEEKSQLFEELKKFPEKLNFYMLNKLEEEYLQGDGWKGFVAVNFNSLEKREVSGAILSNSCDIDPKNSSSRDRAILFSPLIKLAKYQALLKRAGKSEGDIENTIRAIRNQEISYIFYFPPYGDIMDESIILLDNIYQHPLTDFLQRDKYKTFSLQQTAFYLFLLKLSIHFTRFQENVHRFSQTPSPKAVA